MKELEHWRKTLREHIQRIAGIYPGLIPFVIADILIQDAQAEVSKEPEAAET